MVAELDPRRRTESGVFDGGFDPSGEGQHTHNGKEKWHVSDRQRPESELKHGYTPKPNDGYKPTTAKAPTIPPKPPAGGGAGSKPEK